MAEELLINVNPFETRVALVAHGLLQEIHLARASGYSVTGNIYLGKVERVVPGMQAAFVDIGLKRPGFLHARDINRPRIVTADAAAIGADASRDNSSHKSTGKGKNKEKDKEKDKADIRALLTEGQAVLVQVEKDPISSKGARLSTQLALASKFLVLMPGEKHIGISQRIEEDTERDRLREVLHEVCLSALPGHEHATGGGVIARTAAEAASAEALAADLGLLQHIWEHVRNRSREVTAPGLVYEELPLHSRMVRDLAGVDTETILIDDWPTYQRIRGFIDEFIPGYAERLHYYDGKRPLFERHGVEDEARRALEPKVQLRSGGTLVIEQTEAMISVDVNTGGFLGGNSLEETVFRTNLEAATVIPRQLRLRNLGGIIVIDFIDMADEEHRRQVMRALEKACEADPARTRIEYFSTLGLVQMSRKRTRASLLQSMCVPCAHCEGLGLVRTAESTCVEVLRALSQDYQARCHNKNVDGEYLIRATEAVVDRLLDEDAQHLADLAQDIDREIRIQVEPSYVEGQFDIVLVQSLAR